MGDEGTLRAFAYRMYGRRRASACGQAISHSLNRARSGCLRTIQRGTGCRGETGWLEIPGCGWYPRVLKTAVMIRSRDRICFRIGDRTRHVEIWDRRHPLFYQNDFRFLRQF